MQTITIYEEDIIGSPNGIPKKLSDITQEEKNNTSCIIFDLKYRNPYILFFPNTIYEFKIDYYKTGEFAGEGFYAYGKVEYNEINNNYKIQSYYFINGTFKPTLPTREGKFDIIELDRTYNGFTFFKGPIFTEGPRAGSYDTWILNTKSVHRLSPSSGKCSTPFTPKSTKEKLNDIAEKIDELREKTDAFIEKREKRLQEENQESETPAAPVTPVVPLPPAVPE